MERCKFCNNELNSIDMFCTACGKPIQKKKTLSTMKSVSIFLYVAMLLFVLVPLIIGPGSISHGYGYYGYGYRSQIAQFLNLRDGTTNFNLLILINAVYILLIVATIVVTIGAVLGIAYIANRAAKGKETNVSYLKLINLVIVIANAFVLVVTIPYLTFTFMAALTISIYLFMLSIKPVMIDELTDVKSESGKHSSVLYFVLLTMLLVCFFSPIYSVREVLNNSVNYYSYNYYNLIIDVISGRETFLDRALIIMPIISLAITIGSIGFVKLVYWSKKAKKVALVVNITDIINLLLAVYIGSYILVVNYQQPSEIASYKITLAASYYIGLLLMIAIFLVYWFERIALFVQVRKEKNE